MGERQEKWCVIELMCIKRCGVLRCQGGSEGKELDP